MSLTKDRTVFGSLFLPVFQNESTITSLGLDYLFILGELHFGTTRLGEKVEVNILLEQTSTINLVKTQYTRIKTLGRFCLVFRVITFYANIKLVPFYSTPTTPLVFKLNVFIVFILNKYKPGHLFHF